MRTSKLWQLGLSALVLVCAGLSQAPVEAGEASKLKRKIGQAVAADEMAQAKVMVTDLSRLDDDDVIETLYEITRDYGIYEDFFNHAADTLLKKDGAFAYIDERYDDIEKKRDFQERVFIASLYGRVAETDRGVQGLAGMVDDSSTFVQKEAVKGLEKSNHKDAIGPLIELLDELSRKQKGVLYYDVRDALWVLTGQDYDLMADWHAWWDINKSTYDPKAKKTDGKTGVARKKRGDKDDPEFFDVPIVSKHMIFVIDTSGSMRYVEHTGIPGLARGDGSDGGGSSGGGRMTPENQRLAEFWTRMEMAKRELYKVVGKLDKSASFNMINFDNSVYVFNKKGSVKASPGSKKKAQKWVRALKWRDRGATNTMDALEAAFKSDIRTNTIYFLSDGLPSKDGVTNDDEKPILDKVFAMNRFRKVTIHTFGYHPRAYQATQSNPDLERANAWLKRLAERTGGKFTEMKVNPKATPDNPYPEKDKGKDE